MAYRHLISCHVSGRMHARLTELAASRETSVAYLIRSALTRELADGFGQDRNQRDNVLFLVFAMDALLTRVDPQLRADTVTKWNAQLEGN